MEDTYDTGRTVAERLNPGMEAALAARYDALVPGLSRSLVDFAYGQVYARATVWTNARDIW